MARAGRFFRRMIRGAESQMKGQFGGMFGKGGKGGDSGSDRGPQFTEAARSQAAGAGTVGFTQRTQNW